MEYTLADFLSDNIVPDIRRLTEAADFSRVQIRSVSVQELPVQGFIRAHELVLSTAIGCREEPARFVDLIAGVADAHAAALLIAFEDALYCPPPDAIACANQRGLNVFLIPWEHRFAQIQSAVAERIEAQRTVELRRIQTALINLYFESKPLDEAAERIASFNGAPVAVFDRVGSRLAKSDAFNVGIPLEKQPCFDIRIAGQTVGLFVIQNAEGREAPDAKLFEKYVLFPLSLWFHRQMVEDLVTQRLRNDFVWQLSANNGVLTADLLQQGARLGYDLTRPCTCIRIDIVPVHEPNNTYRPAATARAVRIEEIIQSASFPFALQCLFASRASDCICYVLSSDRTPLKRVEALLGAIDAAFRKEWNGMRFYYGVSDTSIEKTDYGRLCRDASLALQYCRHAKRDRYFFTYQDTHMARAISVLSENAETRTAAEHVFEMLSSASNMDLIGTLATFFETNRNTSSTARRLGLHRQSLLYRLSKIEELTGMQLSNARDLYLLETYSRMFSDY